MSSPIPEKTVSARLHLLAVALATTLAFHGPTAFAAESSKCRGTSRPGQATPTLADPYPLMAAGWCPELGNGFMASRWAEDWSIMAAQGHAPLGKAIPVGYSGYLTISSELRLRSTSSDNAQLRRGNDFNQDQSRLLLGADLTLNRHLRFYGEVGAGQVDSRRSSATPNFRNAASLQQSFVDLHGNVGKVLAGAMVGRQEFSDGPRQLISLSDGPNLHRTWNGVRVYAHGSRLRVGAFDLRATHLGGGGFDEHINSGEKLQGINASFIVSEGSPNTYFDPFWIHSENPSYRLAGQAGPDTRDTAGVRVWGRHAGMRFDWTTVRQSGRTIGGRSVSAWGIFATQSIALSDSGWKPRLTSHIDLASGGGAYGTGTVRDFNSLYASSNYLGEGQFLGLSNLLMIAPGLSFSPGPRTSVAMEYGYARRLDTEDAIYAGGARAYAGTQRVKGQHTGNLIRLTGTWSVSRYLAIRLNVEHLAAGDALRRSGFSSGTYTYLDATYRY